jgi:hypothetical protein
VGQRSGKSPERAARGAALPFLCHGTPREISDDLFILCDTLIEGGEAGVESAKDPQVGTCRLVRTLDGRGCRMRRWLPEATRTLPTARQLVRRGLEPSPWLNGTI